MILYTIPGCEPCMELKDWIKINPKDIDTIVELKDIDGKWFESMSGLNDDSGYIPFNPDVKVFPALRIGDSYIVGLEGVKGYLEKGYVYEPKECPYMGKRCIEKKCELFVMINKNGIVEGGCAIKMNTLIALESLKGN